MKKTKVLLRKRSLVILHLEPISPMLSPFELVYSEVSLVEVVSSGVSDKNKIYFSGKYNK